MNGLKTYTILLLLFILHVGEGNAKIYDCFTFYNELDVLEIRLQEMYEHVDKFVIVESLETFRGNLKPLYYAKNKERYKKFADKIIHIIVEERINTHSAWVREEYQRDQIVRGLKDCEPDDLILISDVDEIVRASMIPVINNAVCKEMQNPLICEQTLYRFFLNSKDLSCVWGGTCAITFNKLIHTTPHRLRIDRSDGVRTFNYPLVYNAGWHFTSMGGLEIYKQRVEAFSHEEYDRPENKTFEAIYNYMNAHCIVVPVDESYPRYILENEEYFREKVFFFTGLEQN